MSYQPFLIAAYATGLDQRLQPWLLPNDAFVNLFDGFVYRGVTSKRDGYSGLANGLKSTYTESRMVVQVSYGYTVSGVIDGANDTFAIQLIAPAVPGSLIITGSNPVQTVNDDGAGNLTGDGTGTINYVTGLVNVVFTAPPALASTITVEYGNYSVGDGTAGPYLFTAANTPLRRGTIVITAGAQSAVDDGVGGFITTPAGGSGSVDYTTGDISVTFNAVVASGTPITITYDYHQGLPVMGVMNFFPNDNTRQLIVVDTQYVNKYNPSTDRLEYVDSAGTYPYSGDFQDFFSWVNYSDASSNPRLLFCNGVPGDVVQQWDGTTLQDYAPTFTIGSLNARQLFNVRDRLVLFQTIEAGTFYPRRIRISGTGINSDNFDNTATGAGFIDIPDNTFFYGAAFNRDDILFFTEAATWQFKYTGNDVTPFILEKVDGSRGSKAAFSVISYLNRTMAASPRGLIISDGYSVDRMDEMIPNFAFNNINDEFFESCFSGFLDEDRDVYMLYPSDGDVRPALVPIASSDRILVNNFEEDNFAIYRIPMSCMGNFQVAFGIQWSDLTAEAGFPDWDALSDKYETWNAFPYSKGTPVTVGGGHKGEVWKLNDNESEDNPLKIRDIQILNEDFVRVTSDWNNYNIGDYISFKDVGGMTQINGKQGAIEATPTPYNVFDVKIKTNTFDAYTSGGECAKSIPFEFLTKQLNPFAEMDKKIRIGWIYFYVEAVESDLTDEDGNLLPAILTVDVFTNDNVNNPSRPVQNANVPNFTYQVNCTNETGVTGNKKWVKIWINQTARFLQFRVRNNQAGAQVKVHAMMPGMAPVGRLI